MRFPFYIFVFTIGCSLVSCAVSPKELENLFENLWYLDKEEMKRYGPIILNTQGKIPYKDETSDKAPKPLFESFRLDKFQNKTTIAAFLRLMDNYISEVGKDEISTPEEENEIRYFIDEVAKTQVMIEARQFLARHGLSPSSIDGFKEQLKALWFKFYHRSSQWDSSAFEHVFVGETRGTEVSGYHSWIKFAQDEAKKKIDYRGYFVKTCGMPPKLISLSFKTDGGALKPKGSMFIGTSPELEMAYYTVAFLTGQSNLRVRVRDCQIGITCHKMGRNLMGSCFVRT